jgi:hypothetical protein
MLKLHVNMKKKCLGGHRRRSYIMTLYLVPFLFDPDEPTTTASVV